ncbi:MAG: hypothetical protein FWE61_10595, partial [Micrococcales bacterium]|nr:hypothetical protein [Micrococcales bacterium]
AVSGRVVVDGEDHKGVKPGGVTVDQPAENGTCHLSVTTVSGDVTVLRGAEAPTPKTCDCCEPDAPAPVADEPVADEPAAEAAEPAGEPQVSGAGASDASDAQDEGQVWP